MAIYEIPISLREKEERTFLLKSILTDYYPSVEIQSNENLEEVLKEHLFGEIFPEGVEIDLKRKELEKEVIEIMFEVASEDMIQSFLRGQRISRDNAETPYQRGLDEIEKPFLSGIQTGYYALPRNSETGRPYTSIGDYDSQENVWNDLSYNFENLSVIISFLEKTRSLYEDGLHTYTTESGREVTDLLTKADTDDYERMKRLVLERTFPKSELLKIAHNFSSRTVFEILEDTSRKIAKVEGKRKRMRDTGKHEKQMKGTSLSTLSNSLAEELNYWKSSQISEKNELYPSPFLSKQNEEQVLKLYKFLGSCLDYDSSSRFYDIVNHARDLLSAGGIYHFLPFELKDFISNCEAHIKTAKGNNKMLEVMIKKELEKLKALTREN